jgi:ABC-type lipoprotein export system ATPase subunit
MVVLENVVKIYRTHSGDVKALDNISFQIKKGEFAVLCGPSGSGKTTLLMTIAGMQHPTNGVVSVGQNNLYAMSARTRAEFRAKNIGFVFQMFHLIPYLNIIENVTLAGGTAVDKNKKAQANELIEQFGLAGRNYHRPAELSAGEKQRVAIARALLNRPKIVLADEPTGNLDPDNAATVLGYLSEFRHKGGTIIFATHGTEAEQFADRIIHLRNGHIHNRT